MKPATGETTIMNDKKKKKIQKLQYSNEMKEIVNEKRKLVYEIHAESMEFKLCAWL